MRDKIIDPEFPATLRHSVPQKFSQARRLINTKY
jgi:hypothetical protein